MIDIVLILDLLQDGKPHTTTYIAKTLQIGDHKTARILDFFTEYGFLTRIANHTGSLEYTITPEAKTWLKTLEKTKP